MRHASFLLTKASYIRAQTEKLLLNKETGLLAKCMNYFYESSKRTSTDKDNVEAIGVLLYPEFVSELFDFDINKSQHQVDYNLIQVQVNRLLEHYKESISILLDNPELAEEQLVRNKLREFVLLMTKTVKAPSELDFLSSMFKPNFVKFEEVIQHNLYSNLDVNEFASLCHMSLSTFKMKFSEVYKESPAKYFTRMKMKRASEMLVDSDSRISDIAYDLGYESLTTFNRSFKEQNGQSPSGFRMSYID